MARGNTKFCPRCGKPNNEGDAYCIKCGYSFIRKSKKISLKKIIIYMIILLVLWILASTFFKLPLIPQKLADIFQNLTSSK